MKLSVVIVSYNVKYFLEQALLSVCKAAINNMEIFVVDNCSCDDSVKMVREKFLEVNLIINTDNVGFSKANNQALEKCTGDYILLLNPDTVVAENTFQICADFMCTHTNVGGLGVKTIDGAGIFLPESKRGFPTPWVAFCKAFGLSTLFPKSKTFNQYYLGHISPETTHEVDILVGSFMWLRKTVIDKIGGLDNSFFMYGEDIDLSYRIQKAGFKNYYLADTTIIHYKGESTKKGSLNYVRTFYNAMIIFAKKHFTGSNAFIFIALMQCAVWFRAGLTLLSNIFKSIYLPVVDIILMTLGLYVLKNFWSEYYFQDVGYIKSKFFFVNTPLYVSIWLISIFFSGGYDEPISLRRILRGIFVGTIIIASVYGFLNTPYRFSRMLIILGAVWASCAIIGWRLLLHFCKTGNLNLSSDTIKNVAFVGTIEEGKRGLELLKQSPINTNIIGTISPETNFDEKNYLGALQNMDELIKIFCINALVFCSKDVAYTRIIQTMMHLNKRIEFKILPENVNSIIGSSDKNSPGELYTGDTRFQINTPTNKRNKRVFDIFLSLLLLLATPIWIFGKNNFLILKNIFPVLFGKKTWVGYENDSEKKLPQLKTYVVTPSFKFKNLTSETMGEINYFYAKDYSPQSDWRVVKSFFGMKFRNVK